ncbi:MAG: hypothetical protein BWX71_02289 [Deltaproteobacteria bacterium ADurb.Bin072]|nr:MAG: hypothetical protein BWX71_02289 [Deltaproteobacteria bacterium ADurb.Bin072]
MACFHPQVLCGAPGVLSYNIGVIGPTDVKVAAHVVEVVLDHPERVDQDPLFPRRHRELCRLPDRALILVLAEVGERCGEALWYDPHGVHPAGQDLPHILILEGLLSLEDLLEHLVGDGVGHVPCRVRLWTPYCISLWDLVLEGPELGPEGVLHEAFLLLDPLEDARRGTRARVLPLHDIRQVCPQFGVRWRIVDPVKEAVLSIFLAIEVLLRQPVEHDLVLLWCLQFVVEGQLLKHRESYGDLLFDRCERGDLPHLAGLFVLDSLDQSHLLEDRQARAVILQLCLGPETLDDVRGTIEPVHGLLRLDLRDALGEHLELGLDVLGVVILDAPLAGDHPPLLVRPDVL